MPALATYQRVVIKGTGPNSEIWQTGFATAAVTPPTTQAQLQTDCTAIAGFVTTWWTAIKGLIYSSYSLTEVDMYQYVAPSRVATLQAQSVLTAAPGTNAATGSPIDTACVVSIRSAVPGRSHRGRMYVPCHSGVAPASGMFTGTPNTTIGTATKAMFTSVAGYSSYVPVVVSRTHNTWDAVASLITDNKPDVQRRRENKLIPGNIQVLAFP